MDNVANAGETILEDSSTQIILHDGRITSLLDMTRSLEHISPELDPVRGLFRIYFVKGIKPAGELDATQMTSHVTRHAADSMEIRFEHSLATANVQVRLTEAPGESLWSISVQPKDAALAVGQVTFPVIVTPQLDQGKVKRYVFPVFEGRFAPVRETSRWRSYPAYLFAQMIACVGVTGGFDLWTDDVAGHVKAFGFDKLRPGFAFGVCHQMPYRPGQMWKMPYKTRVRFCGNTWLDAADIYRVWASAQPWSSTLLRDRQDVPDLLRHPPLCISTQIDKEELRDLPDPYERKLL